MEYQCKICGKKYLHQRGLGIHITKIHKNNEDYYNKYILGGNIPSCKTCQGKLKFKGFAQGYTEFCSCKCMHQNIDIQEQKKRTSLKNYGVDNPSKSEVVKSLIKDTFNQRYGVDFPMHMDSTKKKIVEAWKSKSKEDVDNIIKYREETCMRKYGVKNPSQSQDVKKKKENTSFKNYNVSNPNKSPEVKSKKIDTSRINWNTDYPTQSPIVKEKIKNTVRTKYGVDYVFQDQEVKNKISKINKAQFSKYLEKYLRGNNLELVNKYHCSQTKQIWKCLKCNKIFKQSWSSIQQGYRCLSCYPRICLQSKQEIEILEFIRDILSGEEIVSGSREIIPPKELDIYIPSKKVAIEFNGLYWHSEQVLSDKNYHLNKTEICHRSGIQLIHIFEDEWIFKQDIVKSRISNILGKSVRREYARKCIIKEIKPSVKNQFLEENHIQGKDNSTIKLGAFNNNELISVMTFSKGNISKGSKAIEGVWELNRFCSKLDCQVVGIAGKLLSYFKKNYKWEEIFSYADRRWSVGNVYEKLGFKFLYNTTPNYWYVKGVERIHRFGLRKRPDEPKDITEWVLREREGYSRIWDCGSKKYQL